MQTVNDFFMAEKFRANCHKLGKAAPDPKRPRLMLRDYIVKTPALSYPPPVTNWMKISNWPMMGNDTYGDCVEAAAGHMRQLWDSWTAPTTASWTTQQVLSIYSQVTGFNPNDPNSDQGTNIQDLLNMWRKTGFFGDKIVAFAALTPGNLEELRWGVEFFGAVMLGVALPLTAQGKATWTVDNLSGNGAPGSWGGHCIPCGAYDYTVPGVIRNHIVTWGEVVPMSNNFYKAYSDEAWVIVTQDFLSKGTTPGGLNLTQLLADMKTITEGQ